MAKVTRRGVGKTGPSTRRSRLAAARAVSAKSPGAKSRAADSGKSPRTVSAAAAIVALAKQLAQARRHIARLEARADTDFLLDIPNRRGFERELNRSIAFVKRYGASAVLLVIDVDRLKPVNDSFGHAAGDLVLKAIVGVLSSSIRRSDMLGRLGGDEFGILMWNLDERAALAKASMLEQAVEEMSCEYRGRRISPGVSIGVAVLGADDAVAEAMERADRAMYARKQLRRGKRRPGVRR